MTFSETSLSSPTNAAQNSFQATNLLLVRHGQARSSAPGRYTHDAPLSALGRRQADAVADSLSKGLPLDAIYSSNLARALETAGKVAGEIGLETVIDGRLAEFQVDLDAETSPPGRPDLLAWHPDHAGTDGVTLAEFASRVADFHEEVVDRHPGQRVAVISHAGTIDAALRWALGIGPRSPWQHEFDLPNASITEIEFWPQGRIVGGAPRYAVFNRIGDVGHLGAMVTDI